MIQRRKGIRGTILAWEDEVKSSHREPRTQRASASHEIQRKWSREVLDVGFTVMPSTLIVRQRALGLDAVEMNILLHLISSWWRHDNYPHLSKRTIAKRMRVDPSTIQRRVRGLEKKGLLKRLERRGTDKRTQTNAYDLSPLVESLKAQAAILLEIRKYKVGRGA
jgi:predicted transcriptional regulator